MADPVQTGIDPTTGYPIFAGDPQIVIGHRAGWTGMQPSTVHLFGGGSHWRHSA